MYAAQGNKLRDDWLGNEQQAGLQSRLSTYGRAADQPVGVLAGVGSTDFLQAIALLHTKACRVAAMADPMKKEGDWPAVRATRQSLLDLPLDAYKKYCDPVEGGFKRVAAKFLRQQHIYRVFDLPYQSQLVPLAAIFAELGDRAEHGTIIEKIARWFWCGIFGELYPTEGRWPEPPNYIAWRSRPNRRRRLSWPYRSSQLWRIRWRQR